MRTPFASEIRRDAGGHEITFETLVVPAADVVTLIRYIQTLNLSRHVRQRHPQSGSPRNGFRCFTTVARGRSRAMTTKRERLSSVPSLPFGQSFSTSGG
jgi:hypothetical protein